MAADRLQSVGAAAGDEAAAGTQQRGDPLAVQTDQGQQQGGSPPGQPPPIRGLQGGEAWLGLQLKAGRPNR
jgi:hypothetical protein